ncbi:uncharacterized protein KY384_002928 [Bacidia gigantensis]|uniref:uncharacterized protein n=1 Tax=Bacidia gigantensis TaxID=2732470 RepID=UPI001D052FF2|nr:uncharacterized protein KY384_002928 [Bacidia gigantensis]KAG8531300.1 hypothetical protein KY384_002928 [Bacidia gigantensis]
MAVQVAIPKDLEAFSSHFNAFKSRSSPKSPCNSSLFVPFDGHMGHKVDLPSVPSLCPSWSRTQNPHLASIQSDFKAWINSSFKDTAMKAKVLDFNAPLFAALSYPHTSRKQLLTIAECIAWYFPTLDTAITTSADQKPPNNADAYLTSRELANVSIFPLLGLIHYAHGSELPVAYSHKENKTMAKLWKEIARISVLSNDILALRGEVLHARHESLVPLLMKDGDLDAQDAMDQVADMVRDALARFEDAERELAGQVEEGARKDVEGYVRACRDLVVGQLEWSFGLKGGVGQSLVVEDGTVIFYVR